MNKLTNIHQIKAGNYIPVIKKIQLFSADEWETFIEEWLDVAPIKYFNVINYWWAGDKWRDIIWYLEDPKNNINYKWDCYQCKRYKNPLTPSDIYTEVWKMLYYTFIKDFPIPEKYFFIASNWIWWKLDNFLNNTDLLKKNLIENWDTHCKKGITITKDVELKWDFKQYVENFNYNIFNKKLVKDIIKEHKKHNHHLDIFGWELKKRDEIKTPIDVKKHELNYIRKLLDAYSSESKKEYKNVREICNKFNDHFSDARLWFYYAEQLERFYRDSLEEWTFDNFKDDIYKWIKRLNYEEYPNWFKKVITFEQESLKVSITSNPLINVSIPDDRIGICHHLANNNKLTWVENEKD